MRIMLLGSGELGKEFVISAKRLGLQVVAVDRYAGAPAMAVADAYEVIDMLSGEQLEQVVQKHQPQIIVPEIEAIRTEKLLEFEKRGIQIVPSAKAAHLTMNRDAIRDVAHNVLKLKTARFAYAESLAELQKASREIGFPNVVKPVMSSSGKGQSVVKSADKVAAAWEYAVSGMRGDKAKVIVEEFIAFDSEITLLTLKQKKGPTLFVQPIGHRQERGDYQESWLPHRLTAAQLKKAQAMAKKVTDYLGGAGLFGVEFFVTKKDIYFSELSPRPHDTGMVTLISQDLSEFDLHLRCVLGLPIPEITYWGPSASAVVLADRDSDKFQISGVDKALKLKQTEVRWFGKPSTRKFRRMGVALARATTVEQARRKAKDAAKKVKIEYLTGFVLALTFSILAYSASVWAQDEVNQPALKQTQTLLKDRSQRKEAVKATPQAAKADDFVTKLAGGDAELSDEVYALAAEVMANVVKDSNGDVNKMSASMDKFLKDPAAFAATWTPEQKAKLKALAAKLGKPSMAPK